ncbi:MAG TPA: hypothetical protein VL992_21060, partial [Tepidisphaeraceae bacterium]|nr:hypothetical protein [Tepidisphaeraceae bacterium]
SENLVLGLLGGLWVDANSKDQNYQKVEFVNSALSLPSGASFTTFIGTGPQSLVPSGFTASSGTFTTNPAFKQYESFLPVTFPSSNSPLLMNGDGSPETGQYHDAGGRTFNDCAIPVFTDAFPDHMPILYIRARVGAHGIVSGPDTGTNAVQDPTMGSPAPPAHYNYDLVELLPYTENNPNAATAQAFAGVSPSGGGLVGLPGQHGLQSVSSSSQNEPNFSAFNGGALPTGWNHPVPTSVTGNAGQYFMNPATPPTTTTSSPVAQYENATGTPREKDTFILIGAGPDRTYGTGDDETNFGTVGQ